MKISGYIIFILVFTLMSCKLRVKEGLNTNPDYTDIESMINSKTSSLVKAINEGDLEGMMDHFLNSDSAVFIINGRSIEGYQLIQERFKEAIEGRKRLEVNVKKKDTMVLSPEIVIQNVYFDQTLTWLNDEKENSSGIWTSVYVYKGGKWKVLQVHESFFPVEQ
jgi:ketosteroid isomerase-like protein